MTKKENSSDKEDSPQVSPEIVEKWIQIQEEELEVRQQEIKKSSIESENNFEFSKLALEADERTFNTTHENRQKTINKACWFLGICLFMVLIFLAYLVYSGNPKLVIEILKGIGYAGAGGAGGYGLGVYRTGAKKKDQ